MAKNIAVQTFKLGTASNLSNTSASGSVSSFAQKLQDMSNNNTARTFDFNSSEASRSRDWSEYMSNTSHQREVEDLKLAGLNPVLSANSGASAYSGASASGSADSSAIGALASLYQTQMNNDNARQIASMNNKNSLEIAKINAAASNYAANTASSASKYASDNSSSASRYSTDKSYGSSNAGMIESLGLGDKGTKIGKGVFLGSQAFGNILSSLIKKK